MTLENGIALPSDVDFLSHRSIKEIEELDFLSWYQNGLHLIQRQQHRLSLEKEVERITSIENQSKSYQRLLADKITQVNNLTEELAKSRANNISLIGQNKSHVAQVSDLKLEIESVGKSGENCLERFFQAINSLLIKKGIPPTDFGHELDVIDGIVFSPINIEEDDSEATLPNQEDGLSLGASDLVVYSSTKNPEAGSSAAGNAEEATAPIDESNPSNAVV